jgi:uncharacterized damage-inducible protein DinB
MSIAMAFLAEFDQEMAATRRLLESVPDAMLDWKPHNLSMSFCELSTHLSNLPSWGTIALEHTEFDVAPPGGEPVRATPVQSTEEALAIFDEHVEAARNRLETTSDEEFEVPWSLLSGGEALFTMPRAAVFRTMILNHLIHHRAQLGVYLRLNDMPVPSVYGPSADEHVV